MSTEQKQIRRGMEMKEEAVKMLYTDGILVGFLKMNGSLKFYKAEEVGYSNVDQLFNVKSAT